MRQLNEHFTEEYSDYHKGAISCLLYKCIFPVCLADVFTATAVSEQF